MSRIAESAAITRGRFNSLPIDVESIVRNLCIELRAFNFDDGISGAMVIKNGVPSIGYNSTEPEVRNRFTIAHELGHYILHKDQELFVDTDFKVMLRSNNIDSYQQRQEREANEFAACLLMPEDLLRREIALVDLNLREEEIIEQLAAEFNVSTIAMSIRISRLGLFK